MDIKDFYKHTQISIKKIPQEIIDQYDLLPITHDKNVMLKSRKRVYYSPRLVYWIMSN